MLRVALLFLVAVSVTADSSDVLELDADNFDSSMADKPIVLVEFYAPW